MTRAPLTHRQLKALAKKLEDKSHLLSIEEWAQLLESLWPGHTAETAYGEPPLPPRPFVVLSHESRLTILEERYEQKVALRHPADLKRDDDDLHVARTATRLRNGAVVEAGLATDDPAYAEGYKAARIEDVTPSHCPYSRDPSRSRWLAGLAAGTVEEWIDT